MSNQVGLILSFIFLSFFIIFSAETISYQNLSAKCMSLTNNIAIYIQKNGYEVTDTSLNEQLQYFDSYNINKEEKEEGYVAYTIKTIDTYTPFSSLFDYFENTITSEITVYRKES